MTRQTPGTGCREGMSGFEYRCLAGVGSTVLYCIVHQIRPPNHQVPFSAHSGLLSPGLKNPTGGCSDPAQDSGIGGGNRSSYLPATGDETIRRILSPGRKVDPVQ
jgi:hypothetical protein